MTTKYLIGSKLLGLDNAKDSDYLVICNDYEYERRPTNTQDIFYRNENNIKTLMVFNADLKENARFLILNYQLDKNIIGQNFPIEYHLLGYKDKVKELLKIIVENKLLNFNKRITVKGCCSKILYHVAYNAFILQNGTTTLTSEQKAIIQDIHDCKKPISYLDELKEIIYKL